MLASKTAVAQIEEFTERPKREDLPDGTYFQVALGSHGSTDNLDLWGAWRRMGAEAARLSVMDANRQPELSRTLVEAGIGAINRIFTDVVVRLVTNANDVFSGAVYGGPMGRLYEHTPIRWAGENEVGLNILLSMASAMHQVPRLRSNSFDHGIPRVAASAIMLPLFQQKGRLMREYFRKETQGHVSPDELDAVFRTDDVRPPLSSSVRDRHDTAATKAAEDKRALEDESAPTPTEEAMVKVKSGVEIWQWAPSEADWFTFARVTEKMETEGPVDQPGPQFRFSTTQIAADVTSDDAAPGTPGTAPALTT